MLGMNEKASHATINWRLYVMSSTLRVNAPPPPMCGGGHLHSNTFHHRNLLHVKANTFTNNSIIANLLQFVTQFVKSFIV